MIDVNVWLVYLAPQNIPSATVLTLGNKAGLYLLTSDSGDWRPFLRSQRHRRWGRFFSRSALDVLVYQCMIVLWHAIRWRGAGVFFIFYIIIFFLNKNMGSNWCVWGSRTHKDNIKKIKRDFFSRRLFNPKSWILSTITKAVLVMSSSRHHHKGQTERQLHFQFSTSVYEAFAS